MDINSGLEKDDLLVELSKSAALICVCSAQFEPNMSAIDLLFNLGPEASEIVKVSGTIDTPELLALQE